MKVLVTTTLQFFGGCVLLLCFAVFYPKQSLRALFEDDDTQLLCE